MTDYTIIHRLDEIDARLAEIGEHIFNMEVDSKKSEPEKRYYAAMEAGPYNIYPTLKEERRSSRGRRDTDEYTPSCLESIHGDRRASTDRRRCCREC